MSPTFRSLRIPNYRRYAIGAFASNVGTWMHRIAAAWLIWELTDDAAVLGIATGLQFAPMLFLGPLAGSLADRFNRRRILLATQIALAAQAAVLGVIVLADWASVPLVLAASLVLGVLTAFDTPARQAFVSDLVGPNDLSNAVGLNSASFHAARLIGPAIAGVLIAAAGMGWVFLINALTFTAMLVALTRIRINADDGEMPTRGGVREGLRYLRQRPDLMLVIGIVGVVATFGLNFQVTIAAMSTVVFNGGAQQYGLLSSAMAIGSVAGALWAARRAGSSTALVIGAAGAFSVATLLTAFAPTPNSFAIGLILTGGTGLTLMTSANAYLQTHTDKTHRGRVMSVYLAVFFGTTPIGAPAVGWLAEAFGPRVSLWLPALLGIAVTAAALSWQHRRSASSVGSQEPVSV